MSDTGPEKKTEGARKERVANLVVKGERKKKKSLNNNKGRYFCQVEAGRKEKGRVATIDRRRKKKVGGFQGRGGVHIVDLAGPVKGKRKSNSRLGGGDNWKEREKTMVLSPIGRRREKKRQTLPEKFIGRKGVRGEKKKYPLRKKALPRGRGLKTSLILKRGGGEKSALNPRGREKKNRKRTPSTPTN